MLLKKVKKELHKNYGWDNLDCDDKKTFIDELIKDVIDILNKQFKKDE
jgi:uncharacterized protein (DUF2132 family)